MQVQPYLMFDGRCEEAIAFYQRAVGAELVTLKRYGEMKSVGNAPPMPQEKVMHAALRIGDTVVFVSDGMCAGKPGFQGFSLSITAGSDAEAARLFDAIATDGGQVQMPIAKSFFASSFGMVADKFGVSWMVLAGIVEA